MNRPIQAFIDRFDLESYLNKFEAEIHGPEWLLVCPLCGKRKLAVNVSRKKWHCWVCEEYRTNARGRRVPVRGAGGLLRLIALLERCGMDRAAQIIQSGVQVVTSGGLTLPELGLARPDPKKNSVVEIPPPNYVTQNLEKVLTYLHKRGITIADARAFGLGYCTDGKYASRLIFPVFEGGKLVYFQARATWEAHEQTYGRYIKVLNPPAQPGLATAGNVLMNLDVARHYPRVALVEGPVDCVHAGPSAVCTFGKKISSAQILKLKSAGVRNIDLMWDGPSKNEPYGAWPEMYRYGEMLAGIFDDVRLVFLPSGDPGEYARTQLDYYRAHARVTDRLKSL